MASPPSSDPAPAPVARFTFFILLGSALGFVAAWNLDASRAPDGSSEATARIRVVGRAVAEPIPEWVLRLMRDPSRRELARRAASLEHPELLDVPPTFELEIDEPARAGDASLGHASLSVTASTRRAAVDTARWLTQNLRDSVATTAAVRAAAVDATGGDESAGDDKPRPAAERGDALTNALAATDSATDSARAEIEDLEFQTNALRDERRILKGEEIRLWSERTQAAGRLESIRDALQSTPEIRLVRKKLIEDAALAGATRGNAFEDAARIQALAFEEEVPDPVHAQLRAMEENIIAAGTGYQRRLAELEQEIRTVEDNIRLNVARMRGLASTLSDAARIRPQDSEPGADGIGRSTVPSPVQFLEPAFETTGSLPLADRRIAGLAVGTIAGAALGWLVAALMTGFGARRVTPLLIFAALFVSSPALAQKIDVGKDAPELSGSGVTWINAKKLSLRDLRGEIVFLEFFQTTYADYGRQITAIRDFLAKHEGKPIRYVGIVSGEKPQQVASYVEETGIEYPVAVDRYAKIQAKYGIGQATLFILDSSGKVSWKGNPFTLARIGDYELERALAAEAERMAAVFFDATAAYLDGQYSKARDAFQRVQKSDPRVQPKELAGRYLAHMNELSQERLRLADIFEEAGRPLDALRVLDEVVARFEGFDVAADAAQRRKRLAKDPSVSRARAAGKNADRADTIFERGERSLRAGDVYEAYKTFQTIVEKYEATEAGRRAQAALDRLAKDSTAMSKIRSAEIDDKCSGWMNYVRGFMRARKYDEAREYIDKIVELAPDSKYAEEARQQLALIP